MKNVLISGASLIAGIAFLLPSTASAECTVEDPCVLRVATIAPDNTPWADQLESLEARVEEESGGRIEVRPFLAQSDGEVSLARQCKDGSLEAVGVTTGALASLVPELSVFELPFLFDNLDQADSVIDNHLYDPVAEVLRSNGFQLYLFSENGWRNFATSNGTFIHTPEDLAALQMRSQENWVHEEMYRALGGNPVTIPATETTTALSNGNVQGFDNTALYAQAAGWHTFIDSWTVSNHIYQPGVVVYNAEWFDSLPADLQEILLSNRSQETTSGRRAIRSLTPLLLQNLEALGVTVEEMTEEERSAFRAATQGLQDEFRSRVPTGAHLLDLIVQNR